MSTAVTPPAAAGGGLSIAFFGSSLVSAYWNGAATYYRGLIRALSADGLQDFEVLAHEKGLAHLDVRHTIEIMTACYLELHERRTARTAARRVSAEGFAG